METFFTRSNPIADFLSDVHLAPRQAYKSLTLWPLVRDEDAGNGFFPAYVSLGTALKQGTLVVDEVDEGGSVPHVRIRNNNHVAVLFLFGEEIRGAKQNRVANASFLVPAKHEVVIDVSCVEAGRWSRRLGERFHEASDVLSSSLRCEMAQNVTASRARGRGFDADQGKVWDGIRERIRLSGTRSNTEAYADYRASRSSDLEAVARAFHPVEGQVGFVACIGDAVAGMEVIGRPDVFRSDFQPLLRAYAIDAIDASLVRQVEKARGRTPRFENPEPFLEAVTRARFKTRRSLGAGDDRRFQNREVAGCALVDEELVHLTAFPA